MHGIRAKELEVGSLVEVAREHALQLQKKELAAGKAHQAAIRKAEVKAKATKNARQQLCAAQAALKLKQQALASRKELQKRHSEGLASADRGYRGAEEDLARVQMEVEELERTRCGPFS
jgi:hypothetical protein